YRCVVQWADGIYICWAPDIRHTFQNRVCSMRFVDHCPRSFAAMIAVMAYPGFTKDELTEAVFPSRHAALKIIFCISIFLVPVMKGMGSGPKADNRLSSPKVIINITHLRWRQFAEPGENDHQVGLFQLLKPRDIALLVGVDFATFRVDGE